MERKDWDIRLLEFIRDKSSEKESSEIEMWLEDEGHRRYYEEFLTNYLRQRWYYREPLIRRKEHKNIFKNRKKSRRTLIWLSSVASIILLIGLSMVFYLRNSEKSGYLQSELIVPGSSKAQLILSEGVTLDLGKDPVIVTEDNNIQVAIHDLGKINYTTNLIPIDYSLKHTLVVDRGGEYMLELSDGTLVWMNSSSELTYPIRFKPSERRVRLRGEAYFKVNANPDSPFFVEIGDVVVKVTGTEFNINTHWDDEIETVLVNGKLQINTPIKAVNLLPDQRAVYSLIDSKVIVESCDTEEYIAWKDGDFIFNKERLERIMDKLSLWYDFDVVFEDDKLRDLLLSGDLKKYDKVENLLFFFETCAAELRFVLNRKTITVMFK